MSTENIHAVLPHKTIYLGTNLFAIESYTVSSEKVMASKPLAGGGLYHFEQGNKLSTVKFKGKFLYTDDSLVPILSGYMNTNTTFSFEVANMLFSSAVLTAFTYTENANAYLTEYELTFSTTDAIEEVE